MKALITGINGQDGSYLAEFLLSRGYEVHGTARHSSGDRLERISHIRHRLHLHRADLLDQLSLVHLLERVHPDEIYNLAGQMPPSAGWRQPVMCAQVNGLGAVRLLEAVRMVNSGIRFFQASSSEMFGRSTESPQTERTAFHPATPYGIAKLYAHWMTVGYRHKYGLQASCGILYDHESPRRGTQFLTRRITQAAARIKLGLQARLVLPGLDMRRDWGFAGDYVRAFWMMLQNQTPDDYIIATGCTHSLEDFCRIAFEAAGLDWHDVVEVTDPFPGGSSTCTPQGDTSHARRKLLWEPEIPFEEMIRMMVEADLEWYSPRNRLHPEHAADPALQENFA